MVRQENGLLLARMVLIFEDIDGLKFIDSANILGILCYLTASLEFLI